MNKNSNAYIIIYSTVMVVVVALVLAFAAISLKDRQNANVENEMKAALLNSVGEGMDASKADDKTAYINAEYEKYIPESFAVRTNGDIVEDADAFELLKNLKSEYEKPVEERLLPVFVGRSDDGQSRYIIPVRGAGLWGPVWGYIALENDWDTIYGVVFDHQGETPGLGAEIATSGFQDQFRGKSIFRDGELVAVTVMKGTGSSAGNNYAVDAISGGTITSKAVEAMLYSSLQNYRAFIEKHLNNSHEVEISVKEVSVDVKNENVEDNE